MEEMTRRPDFICDPVPGNFRQRFEGRKGKNRSLTVLIVVLFLFAVSVLDAILFAAGPNGDRYAALGGSRGYAFFDCTAQRGAQHCDLYDTAAGGSG